MTRALWCRLGWHRTCWTCYCTEMCRHCLYIDWHLELSTGCDAHFNRVWDGVSHKLGP